MLLNSSRSLSYVLWCNNLLLIRINIKFFIPEQLSFSFRMWILGHDTTASAICWAIYSLGKYQDLQEKVYQELMQVLGDRQKLQWYVDIIEWYRIPINVFEQFGLSRYTWYRCYREDMSRLRYMSMFLREVMRMHAPVPAIARHLTKPLNIEGVEIPANFTVDIVVHAVNHHPDVWPDHKVCISSSIFI